MHRKILRLASKTPVSLLSCDTTPDAPLEEIINTIITFMKKDLVEMFLDFYKQDEQLFERMYFVENIG